MDITCMKNPRENKDIRTKEQNLYQEQKGTYVLMFFCLNTTGNHSEIGFFRPIFFCLKNQNVSQSL